MDVKKKKILIVDDERDFVKFCRDFLVEHTNCDVMSSITEDDAIASVEREKPDLMLLDIKFGASMSGFDILRKTRQMSPTTRVIMITAVETRESAVEAIKLGAIDYLTKPFVLSDLLELVKKVLGL